MMEKRIHQINEYLKKQLWMDFEVCQTDFLTVILSGKTDGLSKEKIAIAFKEPYMISCVFLFTYDCEENFIEIVEGNEAYKINCQYGVPRGNYIFKIMNTNIGGNMYIVAKDISVEIFDKA